MSIKSRIVDSFIHDMEEHAIEKLGSAGHVEAPGIGIIFYDYEKNDFDVDPDKSILAAVRRSWERNHVNDRAEPVERS